MGETDPAPIEEAIAAELWGAAIEQSLGTSDPSIESSAGLWLNLILAQLHHRSGWRHAAAKALEDAAHFAERSVARQAPGSREALMRITALRVSIADPSG